MRREVCQNPGWYSCLPIPELCVRMHLLCCVKRSRLCGGSLLKLSIALNELSKLSLNSLGIRDWLLYTLNYRMAFTSQPSSESFGPGRPMDGAEQLSELEELRIRRTDRGAIRCLRCCGLRPNGWMHLGQSHRAQCHLRKLGSRRTGSRKTAPWRSSPLEWALRR